MARTGLCCGSCGSLVTHDVCDYGESVSLDKSSIYGTQVEHVHYGVGNVDRVNQHGVMFVKLELTPGLIRPFSVYDSNFKFVPVYPNSWYII